MLLNDHWQLKGVDGRPDVGAADIPEEGWLKVRVPGDVHSALLRHGDIVDPFYGTNVEKCRWVEDKTWWYRKTFPFDPADYAGKRLELTFHGLDTLAEVYLNGESLGHHANMFGEEKTITLQGAVREGDMITAVALNSRKQKG